jgi:hypothetical protein
MYWFGQEQYVSLPFAENKRRSVNKIVSRVQDEIKVMKQLYRFLTLALSRSFTLRGLVSEIVA